ncbi:MAG: hypothetical protein J0M34_00665 [Alphaproteobacteria bacterium]|nr:hypothetical protein [Alphaproteobacteria bacterium]
MKKLLLTSSCIALVMASTAFAQINAPAVNKSGANAVRGTNVGSGLDKNIKIQGGMKKGDAVSAGVGGVGGGNPHGDTGSSSSSGGNYGGSSSSGSSSGGGFDTETSGGGSSSSSSGGDYGGSSSSGSSSGGGFDTETGGGGSSSGGDDSSSGGGGPDGKIMQKMKPGEEVMHKGKAVGFTPQQNKGLDAAKAKGLGTQKGIGAK